MKAESIGKVWLVGAGPGDPGLLTLRGKALLERADAVVYDHLANPKLLDYCPRDCERIFVGKQSAAHSMPQEQINELLVERARAGKRVVRLKGGDPFVFGRGGEEAEALSRAGIAFEVVPGVTAAIAGAAYAGIPVTHRDFNSSFTLITGHEKEEGESAESDLEWSAIAKLPCVALYMGVKSLPRICAKLIENGMNPGTPAATIQWATMPRQKTVVATLRDLAERVVEAGIGAPAMTIVGKVVALRPTINWFETRPLFGQTIVVTRTRQQASELSNRLQELGANVIEAPTIELHAIADWREFDDALGLSATVPHAPARHLAPPRRDWDWIILTSVNGVRTTRDRLRALDRDVRAFGNAKIAAIGEATANAIRDILGLHVDLFPENFVAEALVNALAERGQIAGKRFLLLRADIARPALREKLVEAHSAEVRDVAIYETKLASGLPRQLLEAIDQNRVDWITFASSSAARNFATLLGADYASKMNRIRLASIGPITTSTLAELGLEPAAQAQTYDIDGLVASILQTRATP